VVDLEGVVAFRCTQKGAEKTLQLNELVLVCTQKGANN